MDVEQVLGAPIWGHWLTNLSINQSTCYGMGGVNTPPEQVQWPPIPVRVGTGPHDAPKGLMLCIIVLLAMPTKSKTRVVIAAATHEMTIAARAIFRLFLSSAGI